jgi:hypothetical protein
MCYDYVLYLHISELAASSTNLRVVLGFLLSHLGFVGPYDSGIYNVAFAYGHLVNHLWNLGLLPSFGENLLIAIKSIGVIVALLVQLVPTYGSLKVLRFKNSISEIYYTLALYCIDVRKVFQLVLWLFGCVHLPMIRVKYAVLITIGVAFQAKFFPHLLFIRVAVCLFAWWLQLERAINVSKTLDLCSDNLYFAEFIDSVPKIKLSDGTEMDVNTFPVRQPFLFRRRG